MDELLESFRPWILAWKNFGRTLFSMYLKNPVDPAYNNSTSSNGLKAL